MRPRRTAPSSKRRSTSFRSWSSPISPRRGPQIGADAREAGRARAGREPGSMSTGVSPIQLKILGFLVARGGEKVILSSTDRTTGLQISFLTSRRWGPFIYVFCTRVIAPAASKPCAMNTSEQLHSLFLFGMVPCSTRTKEPQKSAKPHDHCPNEDTHIDIILAEEKDP